MNALIEQWGARNVGIALLVVAALVLTAAVLIGLIASTPADRAVVPV